MGFRRVKAPAPRRPQVEDPGGVPGKYKRIWQGPGQKRRGYPSDLTDARWELIVPYIPKPKGGGRPIEHDRRDIAEAILYVLRTGRQWRALPHDFPPWSTVYQLFREWRDTGVWERTDAALREQCRLQAGRKARPTAAIIDPQVAKTTEKGGFVDMTAESA